jgi:hypothetical protein
MPRKSNTSHLANILEQLGKWTGIQHHSTCKGTFRTMGVCRCNVLEVLDAALQKINQQATGDVVNAPKKTEAEIEEEKRVREWAALEGMMGR